MRKPLVATAELLATAAGKGIRNAEGILGAAAAIVGTVDLTGRPGAGWLVGAAFLLLRDGTK